MRLVACDLDGTIVCTGSTISERTLAVFDACERAGVQVVFVTGRPPRWMVPIAEVTGRRGVAICGNGAVVLDLTTFGVLSVEALHREVAIEVAGRLRRDLPGAAFAVETPSDYFREPQYVPRYDAPDEGVTAPLEELVADGLTVVKLLCRQEEAVTERLSTDAMLHIARKALAGLAEPVHSNSNSGLVEISALGVSKASGLQRFAADNGIEAADVVAFGDMPNDVPMLRWAGRGYAMDGGHPEAVTAAAAMAPPCAEDGVAQVLERLLPRSVPSATG